MGSVVGGKRRGYGPSTLYNIIVMLNGLGLKTS